MKTASQALRTLLASDQFYMADLYTFALASGGPPLRYADADIDIVAGGNLFSGNGPRFDRKGNGRVQWKRGLEVSTLDIAIEPQQTDLVNGVPLLAALRRGMFDGAEVELDRAFMPSWGDTSAGTVILFIGRVGDVEAGRSRAVIHVNSHLELLNVKLPRNLYQPSCVNTLFDTSCTLSRAAFAVSGIVAGGSTQSVVQCGLGQPTGWFDLGTLQMTSGANAGLARTVKSYVLGATPSSSTLALVTPFSAPFALGDAFVAYPGCDKTVTTCQSKFNNLIHFKGFPYIPVPETAM